jgi:hypothetical protein
MRGANTAIGKKTDSYVHTKFSQNYFQNLKRVFLGPWARYGKSKHIFRSLGLIVTCLIMYLGCFDHSNP